MSLSAGTKLGPYEIVAPLGAGGMGEVYRAHDAKLKRDVAIKVLPPSVAGDAERLTRFEREAQALAALNHPNIATIYGLERDAIVMELIEGETLAERIARGAIPWSEALGIARQIADALEAAHEKGIVHRDLKPANIKINPDGVVKVLDFGLAKALDPTGSTGNVSESPTLTARATQMGVILGTAAYMSPEQARGKSVDRRADIWAFGCVLFEMVTGRRVFEGDEITDVLARLIERDPDWTKLPSSTAPSMRRLLERCLTKDVKARLRDIGEARIAIDEAIAGRAPVAIAPVAAKAPSPLTSVLPWGVAALFAVVAAVLWSRTSVSVAERPLVRVDLMLPADVEFFNGPALSADGSTVAFVGVREGRRQVFVRRLGQEDTKPVPGTDGAATVSVSPDGTQVVTVSTGSQLRRVSLDTGLVESLTDLAEFLSRPEWAFSVFGCRGPGAIGAISSSVIVERRAATQRLDIAPWIQPSVAASSEFFPLGLRRKSASQKATRGQGLRPQKTRHRHRFLCSRNVGPRRQVGAATQVVGRWAPTLCDALSVLADLQLGHAGAKAVVDDHRVPGLRVFVAIGFVRVAAALKRA